MESVKRALAEVKSSGEGKLLFLRGNPGVGKTSLAESTHVFIADEVATVVTPPPDYKLPIEGLPGRLADALPKAQRNTGGRTTIVNLDGRELPVRDEAGMQLGIPLNDREFEYKPLGADKELRTDVWFEPDDRPATLELTHRREDDISSAVLSSYVLTDQSPRLRARLRVALTTVRGVRTFHGLPKGGRQTQTCTCARQFRHPAIPDFRRWPGELGRNLLKSLQNARRWPRAESNH